MDFYLNIAGLPFHVKGWEGEITQHSRLSEYLCETVSDAIPVVITDDSKAKERAEAEAEGLSLSNGECEFLCMMRQIVKASVPRKRMFIHGAGIAFRGHGYLFTAPSKTGKTTHIQLWHKYLGKDVEYINGDKPVLIFSGSVFIGGTPWAGKEGYQQKKTVPLDAVILLKRGEINTIRRIPPLDALQDICPQIFFIDDPKTAPGILAHLDQLLRQVPVYELHCTMEEDALRCSFECLTGLNYNTEKLTEETL